MSKEIQKSKTSIISKGSKAGLGIAGMNMGALKTALAKTELPRLFYQLVVFVLDGSGSMNSPGSTGKTKGEEVEDAVKQVIKRLQSSKNKNSFDVSIWAYALENSEVLPQSNVSKVELSVDLNPCSHIQKAGGTNLTETLISVRNECSEYIKRHEGKTAQAIVMILSDGGIHDQSKAEVIASEMKTNQITISSTFLESADWMEEHDPEDLVFLQDNLQELASPGTFFLSTMDPEEVRKHMIKSISFVSRLDQ